MKRYFSAMVILATAFLGTGTLVWTQEQVPAAQAPEQQPQSQPAPQQELSPQQLDNLVAPIALYPDPLLSQVLVASTYPLEVVEANQWLQRNKNLSGQQLMDAAKQQPWDPSVQALVAVPDALARLNQDVRWTTDLGNAFLAQESDVMSAVQRMRARAEASGRLKSTPQQTVTNETQGGQQAVVIEPANPDIVYVPYYDPFYVWGPPVFGYYPPLFYPAFGFGFGPGLDIGFFFGGWPWWGGWGAWGWCPNWFGSTVIINNTFFPHFGFHDGFRGGFAGRTAIWTHDPVHRLSVPYSNAQVASRFHGSWIGAHNSFAGRTVSRSAVVPFEGRSAARPPEQMYRNSGPQVRGFQGRPQEQYRPPAYQAPQQRFQSAPKYQAPQQRYQAAPRYQAPQQMYRAPQFRSAPQMSAPRYGGGGGFGGGRTSGGGGSSRGGGGGRRR